MPQTLWRRFLYTSIPFYSPKIQPNFVRHRIAPKVMKLDSKEFRNLFTPQQCKLFDLFEKNNFELRIAGGAVRDLLMGIAPADVDFATTATPTQMKNLFNSENIRMLHKRGEEHGTITCRLDDVQNFEITTLRVDLICDGRRAEVQFTKEWQLDANRRDLTINSLFLKRDGSVIDFFDGINDISKRRVAFVGNCDERIQEDYLRILRYFRFFGRISNSIEHEEGTLNAIKKHKYGLKDVSAERIWSELKRIIVGRMASEVIRCMLMECQLNQYLGLPKECNINRFSEVYSKYEGWVEPMTMIACLCENVEQVHNFHRITKLSNIEYFLGEFIILNRERATKAHLSKDFDWWKALLIDLEMKPGHKEMKMSARDLIIQLAMSVNSEEELLKEIKECVVPVFPVKGMYIYI